MANLNNKYNNSFIYTIRSPHTDKFYIGSTTQKLCKRFANHKTDYNLYVNNKLKSCITSFKIIELGDSYIELLEEINCDSKIQLEMREGELIRIHKDLCINKIIVGRTDKQYRLDNVDIIKQRKQQFNINNASKIKQYHKQYHLDNADKIKQYHQQYHLNNADKIKQYKQQYQLDNADKIKQHKKQYNVDNVDNIKQQQKQYRQDNADKIKQQKKQYYVDNLELIKQQSKQKYQKSKTPKISIAKEDYDFLIYCDKLMNIQYSYKKFLII